MVCYHPLSALVVGIKPNGKRELKLLKNDVKSDYERNPDVFHRIVEYDRNGNFGSINDVIQLPCGQCIGCRLDRSRQWADRCMLELEYHDSAYFVTLTYDDEHVPIHKYVTDYSTGEFDHSLSLNKRDFQLFMKRLRKHFPNDKIRYFAAGEYGTNTLRPHYHAIIFGLHLNDLVPYSRSEQGYQYYNSESFQKCWSDSDGNPIGFAVIGDVTWETCAYTARYIMKKLTGIDALYYDMVNIEPEFTLMSRRPGIARQYYDDHPDIYDHQFINIQTEKGGRKIKPPKYYDKLFDVDQPEKMAEIKLIRQKMAQAKQAIKLSNTSLYSDEQRQIEENNKKAAIAALRRNII